MTAVEIQPRKFPRQQRGRFTVDTILEAATRILASDGLAKFTTNRVAEVAGVSVGSLYRYYPNKSALIAALIQRAQRAFAAEVERLVVATATLPVEDALQAFAMFAVRQQYDQPLLAAALDHEEARLPVEEVLLDAELRIRSAVEALVVRYGKPEPALAARHIFLITKVLVEADRESPRAPPPDLAARLIGTLTGYLEST